MCDQFMVRRNYTKYFNVLKQEFLIGKPENIDELK